jgi:DNA-3-methyladenine glycosylase I
MASNGLTAGTDGRLRCAWAGSDPVMQAYHDQEWGRPVLDDRRLFEKLCLEGFQSGLSWRTILMKRPAFRAAFAGFDFSLLAHWGEPEVARLLTDAGIVRHRGKIESVLNNARRAGDLVQEAGSLAAFVWRFEPEIASRPPNLDHATLMTLAKTAESTALSRELKRRSWSFVGPTTVYAFMQAMGLVNDHIEGCAVRAEAEADRQRFVRPR